MAASPQSSTSALKPVDRRRACLLIAALAFGVGFVVMLVLWQLAEGRYRGALDKSEQAKNPKIDAHKKAAPANEPQKAKTPFNANVLQQAAASGSLTLLKDWLDRQPQGERGWEWHYFQKQLGSEAFVLQSHLRRLTALAFRPPDGKQAASGCVNGLVVVWDSDAVEDAKPRVLKGIGGPVTALAFSKDGRVLAAGGEAGALIAWNLDDPKATPRTLTGHKDAITTLVFDPRSYVLASVGGSEVRFWELNPDAPADAKKDGKDTGPELTMLPHPAPVQDVAFTPDGDRVFVACRDHKVRTWDWLNGKPLPTMFDAKSWATALAVHPDGKTLAGAGLDGVVQIWEIDTGKEIATLEGAPVPLKALAYSSDKKRLAGLGVDHSVLAWDLKTQKLVKKLAVQEGRLRGPWFGLDGDLFPSVSCQGADVELDRRSTPTPLLGVAFGPKDQELGAVGADGSLHVWDVVRKEKHDGLKSTTPIHAAAIRSLAFCPARGQWGTAGEDGLIGLWEFSKNEKNFSNLEQSPVLALAYDPRGNFLATGSQDHAVRLWDLAENALKQNWSAGHKGEVLAVAVSGDGKLVASGGADQAILVWDVNKAEPVQQFKDKHRGPVTALAFSPKEKLLASAGRDRVVRLWNLETNQEQVVCLGHAQAITCLAFSPDGKRLVSGSEDRTVKLWDIATGQEVLTLIGHRQGVTSIAFSSDGHGLASASWDQSLILWNAPWK
jgi:WD40 repeat protein